MRQWIPWIVISLQLPPPYTICASISVSINIDTPYDNGTNFSNLNLLLILMMHRRKFFPRQNKHITKRLQGSPQERGYTSLTRNPIAASSEDKITGCVTTLNSDFNYNIIINQNYLFTILQGRSEMPEPKEHIIPRVANTCSVPVCSYHMSAHI